MTVNLLLFLARGSGFEGWLRLEDGAVVARGQELDAIVRTEGAGVAAIVPGDAVTLHWLELPSGLAPAQAAAAARLAAAEHSAQPSSEMHVAVGDVQGQEGLRCVAIVAAAAMADWLTRLEAAGFDADLIIPETLLLARPDSGIVRYERGAASLYRGSTDAFAAEPDLAELVLAGRAAAAIDGEAFEAGLEESLAHPAVNLRQGVFARRRHWQLDRDRVRRLGLLALALLVVTLAIQLAAILRYTFAADGLESEADRVASSALPRNAGITDASAELGARLTQLRGGGIGFTAIAAPVFAALRDTANAEVAALSFSPDGSLRATVQADTPATIAMVAERIETAGLTVDTGALRSGGGRQLADLMVRPR